MGVVLSIIIIGCGNIAGGFDSNRSPQAEPLTHAGAYRAHGGFDLAACIEPDPARLRAFQARWSIRDGYASFDCLERGALGFDVVSICTPTMSHAEDIDRAIALRPKLIFCEKPVCANLAAARVAVAKCEEAGILLAVNHTRRWAPDMVRLRDEISTGFHGPLRSVTGIYNKGLLNNGGHMIDLIRFLFGEIEPVWAGAPVADHWRDDATIPAALRTQRGVPICLNVAHAADYAIFELQIVTAEGVITIEDGGTSWRRRRAIDSKDFAGYKVLDSGSVSQGEYEKAMRRAVSNIHDAITEGAPIASNGHSALAAHEICERIRRLSRQASACAEPDRRG